MVFGLGSTNKNDSAKAAAKAKSSAVDVADDAAQVQKDLEANDSGECPFC